MADGLVAILGARGMLGMDLVARCHRAGWNVVVWDLPECDITDPHHLQRAVEAADLIVNCAAYTDVDGAESEPERAHRVNAEAVGHLGRIAAATGKWVLHISTDFVFDGRLDRPYVETDPPNPISTYGASKLAGERRLIESGCHHCILRIEWTYGSAGNNFVKKVLTRAKEAGKLTVVDDQIGSPTATVEVAGVICRLLEHKPEGLYHFAGAGYVSRFGVAQFIVDHVGLDAVVTACKSSDFSSPATRPLNSRFDCTRIQALLGEPIESWQGPLDRFLEKL